MKQNYSKLFMQQNYLNAYQDYKSTLLNKNIPKWDMVFLTASCQKQAQAFNKQLEYRKEFLPPSTDFIVITDKNEKRIGSGGATLGVIAYIISHFGFEGLQKRILVIHSGGQSSRIPQYTACGKLFAPVPRMLENGNISSIFDEILINIAALPSRMAGGMLVLSGDLLFIFNPLQVDLMRNCAVGLSVKASAQRGTFHGVYKSEKGKVTGFLHKKSLEELTNAHVINQRGIVDIDTGAIYLSTVILKDLASLICEGDKISENKLANFLNENIRLNFYGDFLYPMIKNPSYNSYLNQKEELEPNEQIIERRKEIFQILSKHQLYVEQMSPANFIHFGTEAELLELYNKKISELEYLQWSNNIYSNVENVEYSVLNSYIDSHAQIGKKSYIEHSIIGPDAVIGENCIISHCDFNSKLTSNSVIYTQGNFEKDDVSAILDFENYISNKVCIEKYIKMLKEKCCIWDILNILGKGKRLLERLAILVKQAEDVDFQLKSRIYISVALALKAENLTLKKNNYQYYEDLSYNSINDEIYKNTRAAYPEVTQLRIKKQLVECTLPVRLNFLGGWSDTPPYCMENGGTMLNGAIKLNGKMPIYAKVTQLEQKKIVFETLDNDSFEEHTHIEELQRCGNPTEMFNLHKACLIALGIIPRHGGNLKQILTDLGGGLMLTTSSKLPKGSGLGGSSIIAGACVLALSEFLGLSKEQNKIFALVTCIEQLMGTGGGWQDQVGGIVPGIKLIKTEKGIIQNMDISFLKLSEETKKELNERLVIVYSGQKRLAVNILRNVVENYLTYKPEVVAALKEIQRQAVIGAYELEKGNIDEFAALLSSHFELQKVLDPGVTNPAIEQIIKSVSDMTSGFLLAGAGGGGFLQFVLKKGYTKADMARRFEEIFEDSGPEVWDSEFVWE